MFIVLLISYKMMTYFAAPSVQLNASGLNGTENSRFFIDCVETTDAYPLVKIYEIFVGEEKIKLVNFCFVLRWSNKLNRIFEISMLLHLHFAYIMNAFLKFCLLGNESEFWSYFRILFVCYEFGCIGSNCDSSSFAMKQLVMELIVTEALCLLVSPQTFI